MVEGKSSQRLKQIGEAVKEGGKLESLAMQTSHLLLLQVILFLADALLVVIPHTLLMCVPTDAHRSPQVLPVGIGCALWFFIAFIYKRSTANFSFRPIIFIHSFHLLGLLV